MRKAHLVTFTFITRVVAEERASEDNIIHKARKNIIERVNLHPISEFFDNFESIVEDTECPYNPAFDNDTLKIVS